MADLNPPDIVDKVDTTFSDEDFAVTVYFNGGPVTVAVREAGAAAGGEGPPPGEDAGSPCRVHRFAADPYFRNRSSYVATGAVLLGHRKGPPAPGRILIAAQFANVYPASDQHGDATFGLQISSPGRVPEQRLIYQRHGTVASGGVQNVVVALAQ